MAEVEIGLGKSGRRAYGFDDIAIVPSRRTRDPEDVDISWELDAFHFDLPLLASAMDGVVSPATAVEIGRLARASSSVGRVTALGAVLFVLATIGAGLARAAVPVRQACAAWAERRRQREEDRKLWELALSDTRVMADLVALSQQLPDEGGRVFLR